ncbi:MULTISPECIES: Lrp/AsnC family transcriptional regulator [unclassified Polaribacter]|jgi:DNA-binding Lrp family transcriptional regulator|uniref:Lrp/AsnC family transcriptional regulator n=1 Tax=unclassified Polaribacter TaxID=196858 RepID=UPI001C4EA5C9|nr:MULTISPECIES: Lrp/AsnC family transcriptional regulator [unclassified Polaribacter]QXP62562.1 Lrp/AsnC family transcriptional regulator [Polaribacter sp. HaHaR_3_91]QXP68311.1 Lrp/AsnC family transcriptional regulator [Polaribacter sp. AHE13PA]QXP70486.1 Lrp/AsnC family transcriptional regulator [Polaribacter sp. R2A056_3_33]
MEKIDETDLNILRILQEDSKKTTKEVAEMLNLTPSPVYERVRRLEKRGYIKKYVALINKDLLNIPITAICMVSLRYHDEGFIDKFEKQIKGLKEVQECYHMAGKVDFFLKINLGSLNEYHEFVRLKLSKIENIGVLESYFVLKEITRTTGYCI